MLKSITQEVAISSLAVDTLGRRIHVEWDPLAPVTPMGQLVFFCQFLSASGLYSQWLAECPLRYSSPNAPAVTDVLGTSVLAILSGACRYAHVTALRGDRVNPQGLGMEKVVSEDSLRRAFQDEDAAALAHWQTQGLLATYGPALEQPWIADLDVTVKPIYGHQEGAQVGYNPHKPGRPSHAYHTVFLRTLRVALDVEVRSGKEHAAGQGLDNLWRLWDRLRPGQRAWLVCGDANYGNERILCECEARGQNYLFRQRGTKGVKQLIQMLEQQGGWQSVREDWEGCEGELQLSGWTRKRRAVVFRRKVQRPGRPGELPLLEQGGVQLSSEPLYEYLVLVTNLKENLLTLLHLYRQRADVENAYDELKNQWGWGGFTTKDLLRCQVAARMVAQVYNWWTLFVRCADPERAREAITSRPLLLYSVGRIIQSGGRTTLRLTSNHTEAAQAQNLLTQLSLFLSGLNNAAEQLAAGERWRRIWQRILAPFLRPAEVLPAASG
jgi:Transposase DDE domain group 1